jgi:photosynthetic reaction center cytochrome c subunit
MRKLKQVGTIAGAICVGAILGVLITVGQTSARGGPPQMPNLAGKTAVEAFKNIQVLKNIPASQLFPTMQFIASSLGVRCDFCHVRNRALDTKRAKLTARKMIRMELAIDDANFGGHKVVTCATCHRGSPHPEGVPEIKQVAMNEMPAHANATPQSSADEIVAKYTEALGGAAALGKITSRIEKGTLTGFGGRQLPITIYSKSPDARVSVMAMPRGESVTAYNGSEGWMSGGPGPPHMMTGDDLDAARLNAQFNLALTLKQLYPTLHPGRPEKIDGKDVDVLYAFSHGHPPTKLDFDPQSGLLLRTETFSETALGPNPTEVSYANYREADGVRIPYEWTIARPGMSFTIQITSVEQNISIPPSRFAAPSVAANGHMP